MLFLEAGQCSKEQLVSGVLCVCKCESVLLNMVQVRICLGRHIDFFIVLSFIVRNIGN